MSLCGIGSLRTLSASNLKVDTFGTRTPLHADAESFLKSLANNKGKDSNTFGSVMQMVWNQRVALQAKA